MDGNKLPSPCLEVAAFRRYYDNLLEDVRRPVDLAESLHLYGIISRDVKDSISSASTDVEQRRAVLDAFQHALLQTSEPSATMRSLRRAFQQTSSDTYYIGKVERFVDGEYTISVITPREHIIKVI